MVFKDTLLTDIDDVFINTDEFATSHIFDGVSVDCVVEETDDVPNPGAIGTHKRTAIVYVAARLLPGRPVPDAPIIMDDRRWTVASVIEEFGMYSIRLEAART